MADSRLRLSGSVRSPGSLVEVAHLVEVQAQAEEAGDDLFEGGGIGDEEVRFATLCLAKTSTLWAGLPLVASASGGGLGQGRQSGKASAAAPALRGPVVFTGLGRSTR